MSKRLWRSIVALLTLAFVFGQMPPAFAAGTTGAISGSVTDAGGKAISGMKVSVASPSQTASVTTDAQGRYVFVSLAPDTYVLTFEKVGYEVGVERGVTVQADQNLNINHVSGTQLATIGRTVNSSSSSLLRAGQTASLYSVNPGLADASGALGGGTNQNSAYSAIGILPGLQAGTGQIGVTQTVQIRGGSYTQTGYQFDGIPLNRAFDQYNNSALPSLGTQSTQVYTGNQPAGNQANGVGGVINQVVKSGTYPGEFTARLGTGVPAKYNDFAFTVGGATRNRNLSWYFATGGQTQAVNLANQFNGAGFFQSTGTGSLYNVIASGCGTANPSAGCYVNATGGGNLGTGVYAPNGFAVADVAWGGTPYVIERQSIANFHIGIPHGKDGVKDDIQLLYNYNYVKQPLSNMAQWGPQLNDVSNGTANNGTIPNDAAGNCPNTATGTYLPVGSPSFPTVACYGPIAPIYNSWNVYNGPVGQPFTSGNLANVVNNRFPYSPGGALGQAVGIGDGDSNINTIAMTKFQYQHNISTLGYIRAYYYTLYSDWLSTGALPYSQWFAADGGSINYTIANHTRGTVLDFGYQLNPQNFLSVSAGYTTSNTIRDNNFSGSGFLSAPKFAYLVNSANPGGACYTAAGVAVSCTSKLAANYAVPGLNATVGKCGALVCPSAGAPAPSADGTVPGLTCGTGTCQWYAVSNATNGPINAVTPKFFNASISDQWKPTEKLTIEAALRADTYSYVLPNTNTIGDQLFVNSYNNTHCVSGTSIKAVAYGAGCAGVSTPTVTYAKANMTASSPNVTFANILQPRIGISYQADPNDVFRTSYGRFSQAPPNYTIYGSTSPAAYYLATTPSTTFYQYFGVSSFTRPTTPTTSYNFDFAWQHQFKGTDVSTQLTPFLRKTQQELTTIPIDPAHPNFVTAINGGAITASGLEFALNKGDFSRDGFAARLAFTYTWATEKFTVFPTGGSAIAGANSAIAGYNAYTSACAGRSDALCAADPTVASTASACYAGGAGVACGTPGAVANPYYNSAPQPLLSTSASYPVYDGLVNSTFNGGYSAGSITPYVIAIVAQYKHKGLKITPSLQILAGARYGTPFANPGVAPDTCTGVLPSSVVGDPRYAGTGIAAGSPYDAASCTGAVFTPNVTTGKFDGIGQYTQPTFLDFGLGVSYDFNKQLTLQLNAANLYGNCFGGSNVPWSTGGRNGCAYMQGSPAGNFYNPGDKFQAGYQYPYAPIIGGSGQSISQGAIPPTALSIELLIHNL